VHYIERTLHASLCVVSASAERVGQGEVGDMHMVAAMLGCERVMVGTTHALTAWTSLQNTTLTL